MEQYQVNPIGKVIITKGGIFVELFEDYKTALKALDGFGHINILWWFDGCDFEEARRILEVDAPYKHAPDKMGIFATRSPVRPNPIALSAAQIISIDHETGRIQLAYIDANDGSPVIDIKPYTPSLDRVESPAVPQWCSHWPRSIETSGDFDWATEFNF
jgi:tRNA-Thr(GGU) m(6)t(6)A37 methyltransferase TsaA